MASPQEVLAKGKTKIIYKVEGGGHVFSKNDMTAFNGKRHKEIPGKGAWSTTVTSNIFAAFAACHLPVAFYEQVDEQTFFAPVVQMLPFEVVVRRYARGSVITTHGVADGRRFEKLPVQIFLKTSDCRVGNITLPQDDMLVTRIRTDGVEVSRVDCLLRSEPPIFVQWQEISSFVGPMPFTKMQRLARQGFLLLEDLWRMQGLDLQDCKFEFGLSHNSTLLFADVIDPDSWRLRDELGRSYDKDPFRNIEDLDEAVAAIERIYPLLAKCSGEFEIPGLRAQAKAYMNTRMERQCLLPDEIETATAAT
jgi:phosphoribosylaminoimidazole-succinocarboxamide synthase